MMNQTGSSRRGEMSDVHPRVDAKKRTHWSETDALPLAATVTVTMSAPAMPPVVCSAMPKPIQLPSCTRARSAD